GIAIITDIENKVTDISKEELVDIYTGEITNWEELGGENTPITVIGREAASGTRGAFEELLEVEDMCAYAQELDSTGTVLATVASTEGAIGYVSLDVINDSVATIKLDGVEASEENIIAGDYILYRPFVMATKGEIAEQDEVTQAFFAYIASKEGQSIIQQVGLILPQ
ncbi:MAG: substrate-binding domain-containing protein, partial [Lachnospiraceae bacterium]|nr:substrate-binding domain-containing protein [Lachnospiraceae bacterium]